MPRKTQKGAKKKARGVRKAVAKTAKRARRTVKKAAAKVKPTTARTRKVGRVLTTAGILLQEGADAVDSMTDRAVKKTKTTGKRRR